MVAGEKAVGREHDDSPTKGEGKTENEGDNKETERAPTKK